MNFDRLALIEYALIAIKNVAIMSTHQVRENPAACILQLENLCYQYPQHPLFDSLSACIGAGVTLVLGGDGSGKTTLLRLLAGELLAQSGALQINGLRLKDQPDAYRQQLFWIDPRSSAFDQISPLQFFAEQRQCHPGFLPPEAPRLAALLEGLSLAPHLDKPMYMLSTGSKRKVWLAAAFAAGATVTLLDDPFAALDKPSITFVLKQLAIAANDPARAFVTAHFDVLASVSTAQVITLGD